MYTVSVFQYFSSAHFLREYKGKCEKLHGHNWKVTVEVSGNGLDTTDLLVDFGVLKKHLSDVLGGLDHRVLNDEVEYFKKANPSAEQIARYIYAEMKQRLDAAGIRNAGLAAVTVGETETSSCRYEE
jgi:6-pyruvoyltetrahydropterin/6-carboxytetrahydropterin synthase